MVAITVAMMPVLLPQEDKGQEEGKSTQGDEKDKGQGHLCHVQGLHPDQGLDQGHDTGKVDMMITIITSLRKKTTHNLCITPVLPSPLPTVSM